MKPDHFAKKVLEEIIFNSKWVLNVFYFGLIAILLLYSGVYVKEVWHLLWDSEVHTMDKNGSEEVQHEN